MKNPNINNSKKRKGKTLPYNIFNDLLEYENEPNIQENSEPENSEEENYFYEDETKIDKDDFFEESKNIDVIKYPEKTDSESNTLNANISDSNILDANIDLSSLDEKKQNEFPPEDISYPPGFERHEESNKSFENNSNTYTFLQRNNIPIVINFKTNEIPYKNNFRSTFFHNKYPYHRVFDNSQKSIKSSDLFIPFSSTKSHDLTFRKSDFSFRDIKPFQKENNENSSFSEIPKNKSMIPTKKFTFGNRGTKDMKCIKSFGIILFTNQNKNWRKINENSNNMKDDSQIYYLIYQRRDTYGFMDFMRGLWNDDTKMYSLLSMISKDERKRLLNYNFDDLWEDLWMSHSPDPTGIYVAGKERARKKFYSVKEKVTSFLQNPANKVVCDAPWGFPKGKKNSKEGDIECAKREFFEETRIDPVNINILTDLGIIIENYVADNDKYYTTFYYIAETSNILPVKHMPTPGCIRTSAVSDEVANLIWATYLDSSLLLDDQKRCILEEAHSRIIRP